MYLFKMRFKVAKLINQQASSCAMHVQTSNSFEAARHIAPCQLAHSTVPDFLLFHCSLWIM